TPAGPHISIGFNQDRTRDLDEDFCARRGLQVIGRRLGGGAVYIDRDQLFFHFIVPAASVSHRPPRLFATFAEPVVATYAALGIAAAHRPPADIVVGERKLGAIAAAAIGEAM